MNLIRKFYSLILFFGIQYSYSQFAEKGYYLIDSMDLETLGSYDRELLDSALSLYHDTNEFTAKLSALEIITENMSNTYWYDYNSLVLDHAENQLTENKVSGDIKLSLYKILSNALTNKGYIENAKGNNNLALDQYFNGLRIRMYLGDKSAIANSLSNIGLVYGEIGDIANQSRYYHESLLIREQIGDKEGSAICLNNIGHVFKNQGESGKALTYFNDALNIFTDLKDERKAAATLNNIGLIYNDKGEYSKAKEYYNQSLTIRIGLKDEYGMSKTYLSIGGLFSEQSLLDSAQFYFEKSLTIQKKIGDKKGESVSLYNLGKIKSKLGLVEEAINDLEISYELSQKFGIPSIISEVSKLLSQLYESKEKYEKSLDLYKVHILMRDSISNKDAKIAVIKNNLKYEHEKKALIREESHTREVLLAKQKDDQKTFIIYVILVFSVGLLILLFVIVRKLKTIQNQKSIIEKKTIELHEITNSLALSNVEQNKLLVVKETLLKETHHRVKNNLQVIASLMSLQKGFIEDEKSIKHLQNCENRVKSMALIHEMLYRYNDISKIDLKYYIDELLKGLVLSLNTNSTDIEVNIDIEDIQLNIDTAVPLGLIVNEIVSNSISHGLKGDTSDQITIKVEQLEESKYVMNIGDNGKGMSEDIIHESRTTLGLSLINGLSHQLKGKAERLKSEKGVQYRIVFKDILSSGQLV